MTEESTNQAATSTAATDPPPPLAARYGLVRPLQGRYVAGVGAALGRATRTDPVLWRVVLAVLICFAGLGALIYLVIWLLTPEEGDTASPLESLLGRGHSNTSPVLTGLLSLIVVGLLAVILPRPFYLIMAAAVALGFVLLVNRVRTAPPAGPSAETPPPAGFTPVDAPPVDAPPAGAPSADPQSGPLSGPLAGPPSTPPSTPHPEPLSTPPAAPGTPPLPGAVPVRTGPWPAAPPTPGMPPPGPAPGGYRPPFAPHGPFAGSPLPPPPRPPRPPRQRSPLPALAFFTTVAVLGLLGGLDALGVLDIPIAGYVASALAVVGTGLVVGAWLGRARVLIALGAVLALALPMAHAMDTWDRPEHFGGEFFWTPQSTAELSDQYELMFGAGVLDLRALDLSGREVTVTAQANFGEIRIIVPEEVAVEATVDTRFGSARVLGTTSEGVTGDTITDPGSGDPSDGTLVLNLRANFGHVEVHR